jgi:hypothetical protein
MRHWYARNIYRMNTMQRSPKASYLPNVSSSLITRQRKKFMPTKGNVKMVIISDRPVPEAVSDAATMHGRSDVESVETVIDFTRNADVGLCLGVNAAMNHFSPFLLILLCFAPN